MKARNSSGSTAGIRAVLASLAMTATIWPAAPKALGSPGHSPTPQAAEEKPLRLAELLVLEDHLNEVTVGLHIGLAKGWYLYWLNPGDAGLAPAVQWQLPPGYSAEKLRFPTPEKFVHGDIATYGFRDETLILCGIRRPETPRGADTPIITAVLKWIACRESCITGKSTAQVDLPR